MVPRARNLLPACVLVLAACGSSVTHLPPVGVFPPGEMRTCVDVDRAAVGAYHHQVALYSGKSVEDFARRGLFLTDAALTSAVNSIQAASARLKCYSTELDAYALEHGDEISAPGAGATVAQALLLTAASNTVLNGTAGAPQHPVSHSQVDALAELKALGPSGLKTCDDITSGVIRLNQAIIDDAERYGTQGSRPAGVQLPATEQQFSDLVNSDQKALDLEASRLKCGKAAQARALIVRAESLSAVGFWGNVVEATLVKQAWGDLSPTLVHEQLQVSAKSAGTGALVTFSVTAKNASSVPLAGLRVTVGTNGAAVALHSTELEPGASTAGTVTVPVTRSKSGAYQVSFEATASDPFGGAVTQSITSAASP